MSLDQSAPGGLTGSHLPGLSACWAWIPDTRLTHAVYSTGQASPPGLHPAPVSLHPTQLSQQSCDQVLPRRPGVW